MRKEIALRSRWVDTVTIISNKKIDNKIPDWGEKEGKIPYTWREKQVNMKIFENNMRIHGFS